MIQKLLCKIGIHKRKYVPGKLEYPRNYYLCRYCNKIIKK